MTPRAVLVVAAAGLVAAACTQSPPPEASGPRGADATETSSSTDTTDAEPTCHAELAELDRRDEAGSIDWEAIEGSEEEPTEQELESVMIDRDPFPGEVAAEGQRPTFPDFPDRLDVATLSDRELVEAVDICYEVGLLVDEEPADDATG
jgi:hypothetical protein